MSQHYDFDSDAKKKNLEEKSQKSETNKKMLNCKTRQSTMQIKAAKNM